ncbi:MAG: hypothetical protein AAF845_20490 [Bacteroidota bacterium]
MTPIRYRTTGGYDADFEVAIAADGTYTVEGGSYVTRGRRTGTLPEADQTEIDRLGTAVEARDWGAPEGSEGFVHHLEVGEKRVLWWGPAADVDARLGALVAALGRL